MTNLCQYIVSSVSLFSLALPRLLESASLSRLLPLELDKDGVPERAVRRGNKKRRTEDDDLRNANTRRRKCLCGGKDKEI
jgi:hypothetical protein